MLDYRMETFITVCKVLNYTRAAKALHITQPTVSLHIHSLEEYYNTKLFVFHGKKIELSVSGKLLLEAAITQFHDEDRLKKKMLQNPRSSIRLGATQSVAEGMLCDPLAEFLNHQHQYAIKLEIDNTNSLLQHINQGVVDAAFVEGYFPIAEFDFALFTKESFIAVCSPSYANTHPFSNLHEAFCHPLILREEGSGTRHILEHYLREHHYSLHEFTDIIEIGSIHLIKEIVQKGCGITFIYERVVADELKTGTLKKIPLQDFSIQHDINFIWRKESTYTSEYQRILNIFKMQM